MVRSADILAVTIPERPGAFKAFCEQIGHRNITEFNYRFADENEAHIFVGVTIDPTTDDRTQLVDRLNAADLPVVDMTDNELAKLHIRHMVGGRSPEAGSELVFRFEFPERPGALLKFLNKIGSLEYLGLSLPKPRCRVWTSACVNASKVVRA